MCGLSLAWVTSENSTSTSNADILSRSSSLDPILSPTVSGVRCWLPLSVVPRQLSAARLSAVQRQLPSAGSRRQLPFASPYHFRIRRDFRSKNPLSGFAPKQTKESSALAAYPHSATGVLRIPQSSSITGNLQSDCLVSYPGHSLGESYPFAEKQSVYSTAPADWINNRM